MDRPVTSHRLQSPHIGPGLHRADQFISRSGARGGSRVLCVRQRFMRDTSRWSGAANSRSAGIANSKRGYHTRIRGEAHTQEDVMTIFDRCCDRTKRLMLVTGSALLASAIASSAAADTVRWRSVIGIIQAGNVVGNIGGGGQPWAQLGGHARGDLSPSRGEFEVRGRVLAGGKTNGAPGHGHQLKGPLGSEPG